MPVRASDGTTWGRRRWQTFTAGEWVEVVRPLGTHVMPSAGPPPAPPWGAVVVSPNPSPIASPAALTGPRYRFGASDNPEVLNGQTLPPGAVVEFERGSSWPDLRLVITGAGTAAQPVLLCSVGAANLRAPTFKAVKSGRYKDDGVISVEGTHVHVRDLAVRDSASIAFGVNAADAVVHNVEVSNCVHGMWVRGDRARLWNSYVHDGRMMPNTPGPNDDYGACGVTVEANDVRIEGLTGRRLLASSPDYDQYGGDGSYVEVWMKGDNLVVAHGYAETTPRILEAGGIGASNYARNMTVRGVYGADIRDDPFYLNPVGEYSGIVTTGFNSQDCRFELTPSHATATGDPTPDPDTPPAPDQTAVNREIAMQMAATMEASTLDWTSMYDNIEDIGDGRGYTAGIAQVCSGTGDMLVLLKAARTSYPGNSLEGWIPELEQIMAAPYANRPSLSHSLLGTPFINAWKTAAATSWFQQSQRAELSRLYWDPAAAQAIADGVGLLGLCILYDISLNHGVGTDPESFGGIVVEAASRAAPPSAGGSERAYLQALITRRSEVLQSWGDLQANGRQTAHQYLLDNNPQLGYPIAWSVYGDSYAIQAPPVSRWS